MKKEFNLSKKIIGKNKDLPEDVWLTELLMVKDVKEFIKRLLTPNNISKGFVEVSTIKYYAGDKLI